MSNYKLPRYRTIKECLAEIKKSDNATVLSEYYIRNLTKKNEIDFLTSGNKIYVNLDSLLVFLSNRNCQNSTSTQSKSEKYFDTPPFKRR